MFQFIFCLFFFCLITISGCTPTASRSYPDVSQNLSVSRECPRGIYSAGTILRNGRGKLLDAAGINPALDKAVFFWDMQCKGTIGYMADRENCQGQVISMPREERSNAYIACMERSGWSQDYDTSDKVLSKKPSESLAKQEKDTTNQAVLEDSSNGYRIYNKNCVVCHGQTGDGKGPAANALNPRPTDLRHSSVNRAEMIRIIREGIPGTSMVGFNKYLDQGQLEDLAEYLWSIR